MTALDKFYEQMKEWYGTNIMVEKLYKECKIYDVNPPTIEIGADTRSFVLVKDGQSIKAAKKVVELVSYLQTHKDRVISYDELLINIWGRSDYISKSTVTVHVNKARKILGPNCIRLAKRVGYQWDLN
jgi:DNA-binding response OmpR family regulator